MNVHMLIICYVKQSQHDKACKLILQKCEDEPSFLLYSGVQYIEILHKSNCLKDIISCYHRCIHKEQFKKSFEDALHKAGINWTDLADSLSLDMSVGTLFDQLSQEEAFYTGFYGTNKLHSLLDEGYTKDQILQQVLRSVRVAIRKGNTLLYITVELRKYDIISDEEAASWCCCSLKANGFRTGNHSLTYCNPVEGGDCMADVSQVIEYYSSKNEMLHAAWYITQMCEKQPWFAFYAGKKYLDILVQLGLEKLILKYYNASGTETQSFHRFYGSGFDGVLDRAS